MENDKNNMSAHQNVIIKVEPLSIAEEMGIEKGDILLAVNDSEIQDIFDYRYAIKDEYIEVLIEKHFGEEWLLEIEKDIDEDLGIVFESGLMDCAKSCKNKCIFCFIDQLPKGMRETLYFKDDDSRLSFLQGNYVTLTNMSEKDLDRIIFYHLSPINISVHATNPELRRFMLKNPNSEKLKYYMDKIAAGNIEMNYQVVLCNGINDGEHLDKTISDLSEYIPHGKSLSIVPVGISKYRDRLYPLTPFGKEDARKVIEQVNYWQKKIKEKHKTSFVYASDEFYLTAGYDFPEVDYYEDFPQIENGVGMAASFRNEFYNEIDKLRIVKQMEKMSIVTGRAAEGLMKELCGEIQKRFGININVYAVNNDFFGHNITVSGLLTGNDIIKTLSGKDLGRKLLIPKNALKRDEDIFLDDISLMDMESSLNIKIESVENTGADFINAIFSK